MESAATKPATLGARLRYVRGSTNQKDRATALTIAVSSYQHYERDERSPDADFLARLVGEGWNANWLLTGEGPERLEQLQAVTDVAGGSQPLKPETLRIALQLATEALEDRGMTMSPSKRAEFVVMLYELLEEGLPEAKVLRFARQAAA